MRKAILALSIIGLVLASLTGCGKSNPAGPSSSNPLVGTWNMTQRITTNANGSADTLKASATVSESYVISSNNTYSLTQNLPTSSGTMSGTWSVQGDTISLVNFVVGTQKCAYAISGSALTLTYMESLGAQTWTVVEKYTKQ
jgi:hypothetical protein